MSGPTEAEYFAERARQSTRAASRATDVGPAGIYRKMASEYDRLATSQESAAPQAADQKEIHTVLMPQNTPLEIAAVDGNVTVSGELGELMSLTPDAANLSSDRLLARAREAAAQVP